MGSISLLRWRKAYMLEFIECGVLKECFTFSVPPESEEFDFPQRLNETKTFGGSVFDDYGNDTYRITLSGTTINEEKKLIYRGATKTPLYLTGTKEIFELQKIIKNWADGKAATGFSRNIGNIGGNRKVYLYDLSKMSVLQLATGVASRNYWRVFIKDLKIKRDKSKPKTFNYVLEMYAVEDNYKTANGLFGDVSGVINKIQDIVDSVQSIVDITEATTAAAAQLIDHCNKVEQAVARTKNRDINGSLIALNIGSGIDMVSRIMGGDSISFYNSTKNLLHAAFGFNGLIKNSSVNTFDDKGDLLADYSAQIEERTVIAVAAAKGAQSNPVSVVFVNAEGNDEVITVYDFSYYIWKSTDTLDRLAAEVLGNANYSTIIAYFNGIANESELEAGVKIKIPILSENFSNTNNRIFAKPGHKNNCGIDIKLDDDGDLEVFGGDLKTISGRENLNQAIAMRLTTASNKRIRLSAYGIRSTVGDPVAVESYLSGSIEQTLRADPRVAEINELTFKGDADKLRLGVVYTDINGSTVEYEGVF